MAPPAAIPFFIAPMRLLDLPEHLLATVAGFLPGEDKVEFAATCTTTRHTSVHEGSTWWSGDDIVVTVTDETFDSFVAWARAHRDSGRAPVEVNSLHVELETPSATEMRDCLDLAAEVLRPVYMAVHWTAAFRLGGFSTVEELVVYGPGEGTLLGPGVLPPNVESVDVYGDIFTPTSMKLIVPPTTTALRLFGVKLGADSLCSFVNVDVMCLGGFRVEDDVTREMWTRIPIISLQLEVDNDDDHPVEMVLDADIPCGCYPPTVKRLTVSASSRHITRAAFRVFTLEALRGMTDLNLCVQGAFMQHAAENNKLYLGDYPFTNLSFSIHFS